MGQASDKHLLRVWVRTPELKRIDIMRLVRHAVRFPVCTISFNGLPDVSEKDLHCFRQIVWNRNAKWLEWIRAGDVSQFIWASQNSPRTYARIVVKARHVEPWMYVPGSNAAPEDFLVRIGLGFMKGEVLFGVRY